MKVKLKNLQVWDKNERLHPCSEERMGELKASLSKNGQILSLLVDGRDSKTILGGNHQFVAMVELGWEEAEAITITPDDDEHAMELGMKHNSHFAEYNLDELAIELGNFDLELEDIHLTLGEIDLTRIMDDDETEEDDFDPDAEVEAVAKTGDIYQLGEHRLMCGDSTKIEDVEKLMDGNKADMVFTDPPYNADYKSQGGDTVLAKGIENDAMSNEDFDVFIDGFMHSLVASTKAGGVYYVCCNWKDSYPRFYRAFEEHKLNVSANIIWNKGSGGMGWQDYRYQYEFIIYGFTAGHSWFGGRTETDIWNFNRDARQHYAHPTQKPIDLSARAITNSSKGEDVVLDLFGGSGSTLIACEQLNRKCYMMELSPHYVDVIIARWEKFTDKKVKKL